MNYNYFARRGTAVGSPMQQRRPIAIPVLADAEPEEYKYRNGVEQVHNRYASMDEFCNAPFRLKHNEKKCRELLQHTDGTFHSSVCRDADSVPISWVGAKTVDEAAQRVAHGWVEGAQKVFENLATMDVPVPMSIKRKVTRADQGDELDIHAVYRGDLDHAWSSRRRKHTRSKMTVRIVAQTNLNSMMSAEQLFWRGAAVVKLSDMLTEAGYNVEIIGALATEEVAGKMMDFLSTFPLKHANEPLDCEQLAGVLCNAGFHRLYGFRQYYAALSIPVMQSVGKTAHTNLDGRVIATGHLGDDGVHMFVTPYSVSGRQSAQDWVAKCLLELEAENT